jgi:hypothetical protein
VTNATWCAAAGPAADALFAPAQRVERERAPPSSCSAELQLRAGGQSVTPSGMRAPFGTMMMPFRM